MEMYNIAIHIPYRDGTYKHCIEFFHNYLLKAVTTKRCHLLRDIHVRF